MTQESENEENLILSDEEWRERLDPDSYHVLREKGTEPPFSGEYTECHEVGTYRCKACYSPLFSSRDKFDSGSGWPSFTKPIQGKVVDCEIDETDRMEVSCHKCGSHLGHVFKDGPGPTQLRYCINSLALVLD